MQIIHNLSSLKTKLTDTFEKEGMKSYAQFGEDLIIHMLFQIIDKKKINYLDIGANFPKHYSNTYFFYKRGNTGVCIEPDKELFDYFIKIRPRDKVLNIGIGSSIEDEYRDFYYYEGHKKGLNTFSENRVKEIENVLDDKTQKRSVLLSNVNKIIVENFTSAPELISIDVEGLDLEIMKSLDFAKHSPAVICCEINTLNEKNEIVTNVDLKNLLLSNGYFEYANTFINGIFLHQSFESKVRKVKNWY